MKYFYIAIISILIIFNLYIYANAETANVYVHVAGWYNAVQDDKDNKLIIMTNYPVVEINGRDYNLVK